MKLIRSKKSRYDKQATTVREKGAQASPWKVLVADDEPDVHAVTQLSLRDFRFAGKGLHFLQAASAREAREILSAEPGIAVALIDVVMETDDAGLKLVEFIREKLRNSFIRLIIRTGQPGVAPERYVIDHYDIDDYKDKTELTAQKLYAAMRSALKAFRDLSTINANRIGLEKILNATPGLYRPQSTPRFFEEMLTQVTGLCALSQENTSAINALLVTVSDGKPAIRAATGKFAGLSLPEHAEVEKLLQACAARMPENKEPVEIPSKFTLVPLVVRDRNIGFICLENAAHLCKTVQDLVQVMANQCASALENLQLYEDLKEANRQALYMLAVASEYKDEDTGTHVKRMAYHTTRIALEMGIPAQEAEACGQACMLHDIGKIGIPDAILQKPGELNQAEMEKIKTHCSLGAKILRNNKWFNLARDIAYRHHEWWDGNGYPEGIQGEEIPLAARIVAVTDVFDALTHKRPYKDAWPVDKAVEKIKQGANTHFDPKVVAAFLRTLK